MNHSHAAGVQRTGREAPASAPQAGLDLKKTEGKGNSAFALRDTTSFWRSTWRFYRATRSLGKEECLHSTDTNTGLFACTTSVQGNRSRRPLLPPSQPEWEEASQGPEPCSLQCPCPRRLPAAGGGQPESRPGPCRFSAKLSPKGQQVTAHLDRPGGKSLPSSPSPPTPPHLFLFLISGACCR